MLNNLSVKRKLILLTALFVAVTGILVALYVARLAYQNARDDVGRQGLALGHLYQQVLLDPLRLGEDYQIFELISAPFKAGNGQDKTATAADMANNYLEEIVLLDDAGKVLASSHPQHIPLGVSLAEVEADFIGLNRQYAELKENSPALVMEVAQGKHFLVLLPLGENGVKYATLVLDYSLENLMLVAMQEVTKLATVIASIVALMMLIAWWGATRFTLPLVHLTEQMRQLTARHGFKIGLAETRNQDEVMQLQTIFHQLDEEVESLLNTVALRDEGQRAYLQTLELLQDAVIELAPDGQVTRATDAWKLLSGCDELASCTLANCVHSEDSAEVLEQISGLVHEQKQQVSIRFRMRRHEDLKAHYWVEGRFAPIKLNGVVVSIRGVVRDITNTYKQERQINHMALHDALTDLPNRVLLEDRMEMALTRAERSGKRVALGFIDLDHFKQVNDNFGHKIGDRMLKEMAQRLGVALRSTDTLSRWGGDEFVVLCPDLKSLDDAREIAQKIAELTHDSIAIDGTEFSFTFSAGFAVYPDDASDSETLLAQADRAMFYAKAQGRNNIQFFNTIAGKETGRQSFYIQSRLASAIRNQDIQAWLQPLVCAKSGKVIGAEVLARWNEAEQGWIPPSVFIPMAESLGLIDKLGQSVWQQALRAFPLLPNDHRLSVNLSKRQLFSGTIVEQFCTDVARANITPERITLEITESIALSDVEYARERIVELDKYGFCISVDDFGVGYSSLSQLHEIPVDELKLDIVFVKRIHEKSGFSMASAIISIAKSLDMGCVAEGVEDARTAELLTSMGVETLQGYHFAAPMPIDAYLVWLEERATVYG